MADKHVKTTEKLPDNLPDKPAEVKDAPKQSADLPPKVRDLVAAEEQEEKGVIQGTRESLAQLSSRLPLQKPSPEQRLERFIA